MSVVGVVAARSQTYMLVRAVLGVALTGLHAPLLPPVPAARKIVMTTEPIELTAEMLAKREARAKARAAKQTPEARAAAEAKAAAEVEAKREARRQRDVADAATLRAWAIRGRGRDGDVLPLVDIGANLVKSRGSSSLDEQLQRCALTGVTRVLVTGTSVSTSRRTLELVRTASSSATCQPDVRLYCTAGVHPHDAKSCDARTLAALEELLEAPECVAVGETGLDYDRMFSPREVQLLWFEQQARLAVLKKKPLFLHERDLDADKGPPLGSHSDLVRVLDAAGVAPESACVHCFTGSSDHLRDYVDRGFRIGLTGFVTMAERGAHLREALRAGALPLSHIMLETDAPFMKPDKERLPDVKLLRRGQCEPCVVPAVAYAVAECLGVAPEEVARATTANARAFFGLD